MKMNTIMFLALYLLWVPLAFAQMSLSALRTENRLNPLGLDEQAPRFSWQLTDARRNAAQTAYEVRVGTDEAALRKGQRLLWASGKVMSGQSVHVPYGGPALQPNQRYFWQVRVWDQAGKPTAWSVVAFWHTGLLSPENWSASWITSGQQEVPGQRPSPYFRKTFRTTKPIRRVMAYLTAQGVYEAEINGKRVGDAHLTPGWTSYNTRVQYQAYDVTNLIASGENAIGAVLGSGWFRGRLGWEKGFDHYGSHVALLMQLEITYADGSRETLGTDASWKWATGPVQASEIYDGETVDARLDMPGWSAPGFDDSRWKSVSVENFPKGNLIATYNEPIRQRERIKPVAIFRTPKGELVADFGQNLVGFVQIRASGKPGDRIVVHHAEVLDKAGNFYTENLRSARQENIYTLRGSGVETFEPKFTFQGFRYIHLKEFPGTPAADQLTAVALYSDMPLTGTFTTSDSLINQLQQNIQWGQRGNFLDVPTDCPQRDERLGWTGDAQAFARTAAFNFDVYNFMAKWMKDLAADQIGGSVPWVIPNVLGNKNHGSAGWADAATIIPWDMYLLYGDRRILADQYESMKAWVEYIGSQSTNHLWNKGFHFGDWLFYRPADDTDGRAAVTDKYLISQCFAAYSTQLLINTAAVLGKTEDVKTYTELLGHIKKAFMDEYATPNGRLVSGTQTAYVLALHFDMLPENLRQQAAARLDENVKSYKNHLTTGFLGTPYLCHVLSRYGYEQTAFDLLMQKSYPSWLYPVTMGATTIWERWDGMKPDSTFQNAGMNSFNHYAYGAIGDWMYRNIGGIQPVEEAPGYKKMRIRPVQGGGLTSATTLLQTRYGNVITSWKSDGKQFTLEVDIPANTSAEIWIPVAEGGSVRESGRLLAPSTVMQPGVPAGGYLPVQVGSGRYVFQSER